MKKVASYMPVLALFALIGAVMFALTGFSPGALAALPDPASMSLAAASGLMIVGATMDIFGQDPFSSVTMTSALEKVPFKPSLLGSLGIFEPEPIRSKTFAVEKRENALALVPTTPRGSPLPQLKDGPRDIRDFRTSRVAKGDRLMAEEIAGIRAFGSETELQQVQDEVMRRMQRIRGDIELTLENMRLGAVLGIVYDADGSTAIYNWFTEWGISQAAEIDFDLDNASPAPGALQNKCVAVKRAMARAGGGTFGPDTEIIGLCGDAFFDNLSAHPEIRNSYLNTTDAQKLRADEYGAAFSSIRYGGITFLNYRGTDDTSTVGVNTDKVKFFPRGARGVFKHIMGPGETFDWVNQLGRDFYTLQVPDKDRNMWVDLEIYTYPQFICTRPEMLLRGKRT